MRARLERIQVDTTMPRVVRTALLLACLVLTGCAGDTYAPVSDRGASSSARTYEVARGDTLYAIAWRHGVSPADLARWNALSSPDRVYPGQTLRLSPPAGRASARSTSPATAGGRADTPPRRAATPPPRQADAGRDERRPAETNVSWVWPVDGEVLKGFSADADGKQGINIGGTEGDAIKAAAPGRVVYSGSGLVGYGNLIILMHPGDYLTAYGYNRELLVEEGDQVGRGDTIARMGRNGNRAMLHFELRRRGNPVDPLRFLPQRR